MCCYFVSLSLVLRVCVDVTEFRAANNGRSTDNVRSKIGFVRSNPEMAGQFARLFTLVRKRFRVSSFKYFNVIGVL